MPAKQRYHHGNLKAALITAALKDLAREGVAGLSLRSVARRAGVSAPAVYRHFADKDALLAAIASECSDRLVRAITTATDDAKAAGQNALEQFRAVGIAIVQFAVEHPDYFRALSIPGLAERKSAEQLAREQAFNAAQLASLQAGQRAGVIADVPLDALLLTANSAMVGLAHSIVGGQFGEVDAARATELAIAVTHVLGHGFIPRAKPPHDSWAAKKKQDR